MSLEKLVGLNDKHPRQPLRADVTNTAWHTALRRAEIKDFRSDLGSAANRS
jgi:hypothetical protein